MVERKGTAALLAFVLASACGGTGPETTNTSSDRFDTIGAKVAFLEKYVVFRRHYRALDFHVQYHNNGAGLVPGPSEWDVAIVAQVPPEELAVWTSGLALSAVVPDPIPRVPNGAIQVHGVNEWYVAPSKVVGVDRERSTVVYRAWAH